MTPKSIIFSFDTACALIVSVVLYFLLPARVPDAVVKDAYGAGITVLAILFSLFIAVLALIISVGDNDYISFLNGEGAYIGLMSGFRYIAAALWGCLTYSILVYSLTSYWVGANHWVYQSKWWSMFFFAGFTYCLVSVFQITQDCIKFGIRRAEYLDVKALDRKAPPTTPLG